MSDLQLLINAAHTAGDIATKYWKNSPKTWEKADDAGPVTEADLHVNGMLFGSLCSARPDYGWLSEETEDTTTRLSCEYVFIIDPIDGTRSFIAGEKTWAHSLAVARNGTITAAVIFLPMLSKLYCATTGSGAFLNDIPIASSDRRTLIDSTVLAARSSFQAENWQGKVPPVKCHFRPSLAYRMALVAEGRFDAMLTLRDTWEWDVAAGTLIAQEAGASVTDQFGAAPVFNNKKPALPGLVSGSPSIHRNLIEQLSV